MPGYPSLWNPLLGPPNYHRYPIINPAHSRNGKLAIEWCFGGSGGDTVYDLVKKQKISFINSPVWTPDNGVKFVTASSQYGVGPAYNHGNGYESTIITLFTVQNAGIQNIIAAKWKNNPSTFSWIISTSINPVLRISYYTSDNGQYQAGKHFDTGIAAEANTFYHVVARHRYVMSSNYCYIEVFVNKTMTNATTVSSNAVYSSTVPITIGCVVNGAGYDEFAAATVYRLALWDRALTDAEIVDDFHHPFGTLANPRYLISPRHTWLKIADAVPPSGTLLINPDLRGGFRGMRGGF